MSLSNEELAAIRERAEAASKGPWKFPNRNWPGVVTSKHGCLWTSGKHDGRINHEPDAAFIAHAREDVPRLLAEVERLTRELGAEVRRCVRADDRVQSMSIRNESLRRDNDALQARLDKVRALHKPVDVEPSDTICAGCSTLRGSGESLRYFPYEEWPCPTIQAIDGEARA